MSARKKASSRRSVTVEITADGSASDTTSETIATSSAAVQERTSDEVMGTIGGTGIQSPGIDGMRDGVAQHQAHPGVDVQRTATETIEIDSTGLAEAASRDRPESHLAGSGAESQQHSASVEPEELKQRAMTMFLGGRQNSVAPGGDTCISEVTLELLVMVKGVITALFNDHASSLCSSPERPDLHLTQEEALGHLMGSLLVGKLLPTEARALGKRVDYYAAKEKTQSEKEKETTRQKKKTLRKKADDVELASKLAAVDAAMAAARSARLAETIELPLPEKRSVLVEPRVPRQEEVDAAFYKRLESCREVAVAIRAAVQLERYIDEEPDDVGFFDYEERDVALVRYKHALHKLHVALADCKEGLPEVTPKLLKASQHNSEPCSCGQGRRGSWPWMVQTAGLGFCQSEVCVYEEIETRSMLVERTVGNKFAW